MILLKQIGLGMALIQIPGLNANITESVTKETLGFGRRT
jgi:hypothetical protein